jgi:hypothetical protein
MPNESSSFVCGGDKGTITPERKESAKDDVEGELIAPPLWKLVNYICDSEYLGKKNATVVI